jgi:cell division protein FtsL
MVTHTAGNVSSRSQSRRSQTPVAVAGLGTHLLAALLVLCSLLFLAWVRVGGLHRGYELSRLRAKQEALMQEQASLKVEQQMLRSPQRLAEMARKLDLVPPQQAGVVATARERDAAGGPR